MIGLLPAQLHSWTRDLVLLTQSQVHLARNPGDDMRCNFCGYSAARFQTCGIDHVVFSEKNIVGGGRRENAQCPQCRSNDRERLTKLIVDRFISLPNNPSVWIAAPERSVHKYVRKLPGVNLTTTDIAPERYSWWNDIQPQDLTNLTFADDQFDLVICNHVLEHIPDDRRAMSEILRALKPGGFAVLGVPYSPDLDTTDEDLTVTSDEERLARYGQYDHVRLYEPNDYIQRLVSAGFEDHCVPAENFAEFAHFAINPDESAMVFRKPRR